MSLSPPIATAGLTVLFVDNHILVVDKPAGLLTQSAEPGDDNLLDRGRAWVKAEFDKPGQVFLGLVHRLDRNVSGVVLFARTSKAASRLADAFRTRAVEKTYIAAVAGVAPESGALEHPLLEQDRGVVVDPRGKVARLTFRRLAATGGASLLEIALLTGRKHQIRAQLAAAGHPVVGDPRYGSRSPLIARPALHASRLAFEHPVRREPLVFAAPLPADITTLIGDLGLSRRAV